MSPRMQQSPADRRLPSVLIICTGNICRSPFVELLLRDRLPDLQVTSRGIHALEGSGMEARMAAELAARGGDAAGFRASQVGPQDLSADLVLTMSRRQRSFLLDEYPGSSRRIGNLGRIGDLARARVESPDAALSEIVAAWTRRAIPRDCDVPDPFGRDARTSADIAARLTDLVDQLVPVLERSSAQP